MEGQWTKQLKAHFSVMHIKVYIIVISGLPVKELYFSDRMKVTTVLFHNLSWDYLAYLCVCASVILCMHVCPRVNIFLLCRLSASCHSWTTHGHICQCHEVEPFPARAGNLFISLEFFGPFFSPCFPWRAYENVQYQKCYYFFKRLLLRCRWRHTDTNVFVFYRNWS